MLGRVTQIVWKVFHFLLCLNLHSKILCLHNLTIFRVAIAASFAPNLQSSWFVTGITSWVRKHGILPRNLCSWALCSWVSEKTNLKKPHYHIVFVYDDFVTNFTNLTIYVFWCPKWLLCKSFFVNSTIRNT